MLPQCCVVGSIIPFRMAAIATNGRLSTMTNPRRAVSGGPARSASMISSTASLPLTLSLDHTSQKNKLMREAMKRTQQVTAPKVTGCIQMRTKHMHNGLCQLPEVGCRAGGPTEHHQGVRGVAHDVHQQNGQPKLDMSVKPRAQCQCRQVHTGQQPREQRRVPVQICTRS